MDLIIISGMSGAGKATAAKALEEIGYTTVDNLPPKLLAGLVREIEGVTGHGKLCVVIDARLGKLLLGLSEAITDVRSGGSTAALFFIDTNDSVLVQRYSETRKHHPSGTKIRGLLAAVEHERTLLHQTRLLADRVIDSSELKPDQLKQLIVASVEPDSNGSALSVSLVSFGFKFGVPIDADIMFDVRFLANPHYVDALRPYDGRNKIIDDFVMQDPGSQPFIDKLVDLLAFALPRYIEEGKAYLTIAIGCTGGRHRSVVVSEHLGQELLRLGYRVVNNHRDVSK
jgi:RNase adapter protein RapZ